jgi:hypothetical protein
MQHCRECKEEPLSPDCHRRKVDVTIRRLILLDGRIDCRQTITGPVIVGELRAEVLTEAIVWLLTSDVHGPACHEAEPEPGRQAAAFWWANFAAGAWLMSCIVFSHSLRVCLCRCRSCNR